MMEINSQLNFLAQSGDGHAQYTYGKELFSVVRNNKLDDKKVEREYLQYAYDQQVQKHTNDSYSLKSSADQGIYSAYFYLGMIHLEGMHPVEKKDPEKALDYYIRGAAKNNPYCYFELSRIYGEGELVPKDERLQFTYLKRAACEGFVTAQHLLGIAYAEGGRLCKRNDKLALAWFREAIRNGNMVSYLNAGDLLYEERPGTKEELGGL